MLETGQKIIEVDNCVCRHLATVGHYIDDKQSYLCWRNSKFIQELEQLIDAHPLYKSLYRKYVPQEPKVTEMFHVISPHNQSESEPPKAKDGCTVTVLTSTYNKAKYISDAMKSLLAQTYPHWQWWLVLDNADEVTKNMCLSFNNPRIFVFDEPFPEETRHVEYRPAVIINKYYPRINTKYLIWLSDDDVLEPRCFETCINKIEQDNVNIAYGSLENCFEQLDGTWQYCACGSGVTADKILGKNTKYFPGGRIDGGCFVQTKESYNQLCGYALPTSPEHGRIVDSDYMNQLAKYYQFFPVPERVIVHRRTLISSNDRTFG